VQAGLRTDYLFRLANQRGGIVLGTGDLSELALGWSPTASATRCRTTTSTAACRRRSSST
jgi:NAD+ synthase (glutamine-hydrolysing)